MYRYQLADNFGQVQTNATTYKRLGQLSSDITIFLLTLSHSKPLVLAQ
jgi:hypothetical protein